MFASLASVVALAAGGSPMRVELDKSKVDFAEHRLEIKMSRPGKVQLKVFGESEAVLAEEEQDFSGRPAGSPLIVTWTPSSDEPVARIEIRAYERATAVSRSCRGGSTRTSRKTSRPGRR